MKKIFIKCILFFVIFFVILSTVGCLCGFLGKNYRNLTNQKEKDLSYDEKTKIVLKRNNDLTELSLKEYLYGVVSAEMPATFEEEALKAQAVAARTETVKKSKAKSDTHKNADVCDDINHCQAYYSKKELENKYGKSWIDAYYDKIKKSVNKTDGITAVYNDEPISAVFHSTSGGITENSKDVWGGDMPYLVSVKSEGEENSPKFYDEKAFSLGEFKEKISKIKNTDFSSEPSKWIENIKENDSGSINEITICKNTFKGTQIRSAFDLRSTNFTLTFSENSAIFKTKGYGHGVGMSQYGANFMAQKGYSYEEILKKYYTGISLKKE